MVLGWLGILPKVLDAFPEIVLPAGALYELFDGRQRILIAAAHLRPAGYTRQFLPWLGRSAPAGSRPAAGGARITY